MILREWISNLNFYNMLHNLNETLNTITLCFAYDQVIISESEYSFQKATHELHKVTRKYNFTISISKTKVIAFNESEPVRSKIVIEDKVVEQVNVYNVLGGNKCRTQISKI